MWTVVGPHPERCAPAGRRGTAGAHVDDRGACRSVPPMALMLRSSRIRRIIIAFTVNRLGTFFGLVALLVVVYDHTKSALAVAALLLAWQALPAFTVPALVARVEASTHGRELSGPLLVRGSDHRRTRGDGHRLLASWRVLLAALDGTAAMAASALLRAGPGTSRSRCRGADRMPPTEHRRRSAGPEGGAQRGANIGILDDVRARARSLAGSWWRPPARQALFLDVGSFLICGALLIDLRTHVAGGDRGLRAREADRCPGIHPGTDHAQTHPARLRRGAGVIRGRPHRSRSRSPSPRSSRETGLRAAADGLGWWRGARKPRVRPSQPSAAGPPAEPGTLAIGLA